MHIPLHAIELSKKTPSDPQLPIPNPFPKTPYRIQISIYMFPSRQSLIIIIALATPILIHNRQSILLPQLLFLTPCIFL